jgi:hypothetical protein
MADLFDEGASSWVGKIFTAPPYPVTSMDIAKFAISLGLQGAVHFDPDVARQMGYPDVIAPPGYYVVIRLTRPHLADISHLNPDGTSGQDVPPNKATTRVAGETTVVLHRPIIAGDEITLEEKIIAVEEKHGRSGRLGIISYEFSYRDAAGAEVVHELYSRLVR